MSTVVSVQGLGKRYGDIEAVSDVSFEVNSGEIFGILGPNGAGKTTTLECLQGLRSFDPLDPGVSWWVVAVIALLSGLAAVRFFRWE